MFCVPVRSRVDAIDGIYFVLLIYFIYTTLTVNQNRTILSIFLKSLVNERVDLRSLLGGGEGGRGGGGAGAPIAPPFPTGLNPAL